MTASPAGLPRALFIFSLIYGGLVTTAGVLGAKQVALGPLAVEAGILAFLPLVIISSAVAALYGTDIANKLVRFGFIPLIMSMLLIQLVIALPAAPDMDPARLDGFQLTLGQGARLMFAGIIAYGTSQTLNVLLFDRLKAAAGKYFWLRGMIAAVLSQIVDTLLFVSIAFYGVFPIATLMVGQIIAKVVLSVIFVPFAISALVKLGQRLDAKAATA
jgi:queuosine precursor transporter